MFNYESSEQNTRIRNEKKVTCKNGQERLSDKYCGDNCPDYERLQTSFKCGQDTCFSTQKVLKDGTCEYCPKYSKPATYGTQTYILRQDKLPERVHSYSKGTRDKTVCRPDICAYDTQKLKSDGECVNCPDYQRGTGKNGDGRTCIADSCKSNQRIDRDGTCKTCETGKSVS